MLRRLTWQSRRVSEKDGSSVNENRLAASVSNLTCLCELIQSRNIGSGDLLARMKDADAEALCGMLEAAERGLTKTLRELAFGEGTQGAAIGYDVFLSHYKAQAGSDAQLLKSSGEAKGNLTFFLDSDSLHRLDELPHHVSMSKVFALLMSPHETTQANSSERFGPFSRLFCIVEIITWYINRESIPAVVIVLTKKDLVAAKFPSSLDETASILDAAAWSKVARAVGKSNPQNLLFEASKALSSTSSKQISRIDWSVGNNDKLTKIIEMFGVRRTRSPAANVNSASSSRTNATSATIKVAILGSTQECSAEAGMLCQTGEREYLGVVDMYVASGNSADDALEIKQATFAIVLLSPGLLQDANALNLIALARETRTTLIPVEVSRTGLAKFDYSSSPSVSVSAATIDAFRALKTTIAKPLSPHSSSEQVQVQLKAIWAVLGVTAVSLVTLQRIPVVQAPYDFALAKAKLFIPGTRQWIFSNVTEWIRTNLGKDISGAGAVKRNTFVLVATAGLGKSVMLAELARRMCPTFASRYNKLNMTTADVSEVETGQAVVGALHFFKHDDSALNNAFNCVGSVARQLANSVEGYRIALEEQVRGMHDEDFKDLETLLRRTWLDPARKIASSGVYLVVLDALDECLQKSELIPILAKVLPEFPSNVGFVLSTRPDVEVPRLDKFTPLTIRQDDPNNVSDVSRYIKARLGSSADPKLISALEKNADGLFLYAMFACNQIVSSSESKPQQVPSGMNGLYVEYFDEVFKKSWRENLELYTAVFAPVLAARAPLPEEVWKSIVLSNTKSMFSAPASKADKARQEREFQDKVRGPLLRLLDFSGGCVAVLHKSMDDFLRGSTEAKANRLAVDVELGHEMLAEAGVSETDFALEKTPSNQLNEVQRFWLSHMLFHAVESEQSKAIEHGIKLILSVDALIRIVQSSQSNYRLLLDDIAALMAKSNNNPKVKFVRDVLVLGERAMLRDPRQLAGQVLGRVGVPPLDADQKFFADEAEAWFGRNGSTRCARPVAFGISGLIPAGGPMLRTINHPGTVNCVTSGIISETEYLFSGCDDGIVYMHDAVTGKLCRTFDAKSVGANAVAVSSPSNMLCVGYEDKHARIFDASSGKMIHDLEGHTGRVYCLVADETRVVTGSEDKSIRIWDVLSGKCVRTLEGFPEPVSALAIAPNNRLISGCWDGTVKVFDLSSGDMTMHITSLGDSQVSCIAVSPDGSKVVVGFYQSHVLKVWDIKANTLVRTLEGHSESVAAIRFADSSKLFTAASDHTIRVWDAATWSTTRVLQGHSRRVSGLAVSLTNPNRLFSSSWDKTAAVWDWQGGKDMRRMENEHTDRVVAVAMSPDCKSLVTASWDHTARIWDLAKGKLIRLLTGHTDQVLSVAYSWDGKFIVTGSKDNTVRVWDAQTGATLKIITDLKFGVETIIVSKDSKRFYTKSFVERIVWDAASGNKIADANQEEFNQAKLAFPAERDHLCVSGVAQYAVGFTEDSLSKDLWRQGEYVFGVKDKLFQCWKL